MTNSLNTQSRFSDGKAIVLYDGDCGVCNTTVTGIIERDNADQFRFAALNSEVGLQLQREFRTKDIDSIIVIDGGRVYYKSSAVLKIMSRLGYRQLAAILGLIPSFFRDIGYALFAANRYRFLKKDKDICMMLTPQLRQKFLDI